jgi:hypothetical protein
MVDGKEDKFYHFRLPISFGSNLLQRSKTQIRSLDQEYLYFARSLDLARLMPVCLQLCQLYSTQRKILDPLIVLSLPLHLVRGREESEHPTKNPMRYLDIPCRGR